MEWVGCGNLVSNGFRASVSGLRLRRFFQLATERFRNIVNLRLVWKRLEETLPEDIVDFIRGKVDRCNTAFLATEFRPSILKPAIDQSATCLVRCREI